MIMTSAFAALAMAGGSRTTDEDVKEQNAPDFRPLTYEDFLQFRKAKKFNYIGDGGRRGHVEWVFEQLRYAVEFRFEYMEALTSEVLAAGSPTFLIPVSNGNVSPPRHCFVIGSTSALEALRERHVKWDTALGPFVKGFVKEPRIEMVKDGQWRLSNGAERTS